MTPLAHRRVAGMSLVSPQSTRRPAWPVEGREVATSGLSVVMVRVVLRLRRQVRHLVIRGVAWLRACRTGRRPTDHLVFYALATAGLVALGAGLWLTRQADAVRALTAQDNVTWTQFHRQAAELRVVAANLAAPGHGAIALWDVQAERTRLDHAKSRFTALTEAVAVSVQQLHADAITVATTRARIEVAGVDVVTQTREVLELLAADRSDLVSLVAAERNRDRDRLNQAIDDLADAAQRAHSGSERERLARTQFLQQVDVGLRLLLLGLVVVMMLCSRRISVVARAQIAHLATLNARLEDTIGEHAAALERAHRDVDLMNQALAAHVDDLTSAKAELATQEGALHRHSLTFQEALRHLPHAVSWFDAGQKLVVCNQPYAAMWRLTPELCEPGAPYRDVAMATRAAGVVPMVASAEIETGRAEAERERRLWQRVVGTQDDGYMSVRHVPMPDGGILSTFTDVTTLRRLEQHIEHLAHHDALTGLLNRHGLPGAMEQSLARLARGEGFAVLGLDLDHFKHVNDTLGHPIGDKLLRAVADRLHACVRDTDLVARIGGDEFAIIQVLAQQPDGATHLAQRLIDTISAPYEIDEHRITVGTSIGIALAPVDGRDVDTLLKHADLALYRAKAEGRGRFRLYEPEMDTCMRERRRLEVQLRAALAAEQFTLHYQPLVDTRSRTIVGFEALLRWRHPERGLLTPIDFLAVAEDIGLMSEIGAWVLQTACREATLWPGRLKIAVNVSPTQFRNDRLGFDVVASLAASGLEPDRLELEITESVLLSDGPGTLTILQRLRDIGVKIALDDFGTGYSSLAYLRQFPFDKVKIDRTFIQGAGNDDAAMAIIRAVVGLSGNLGMATTAEGVETDAQLSLLRAEGCNEAQGYIFSRPVAPDAIGALLATLADAAA